MNHEYLKEKVIKELFKAFVEFDGNICTHFDIECDCEKKQFDKILEKYFKKIDRIYKDNQ